jgi:hypothetical protein
MASQGLFPIGRLVAHMNPAACWNTRRIAFQDKLIKVALGHDPFSQIAIGYAWNLNVSRLSTAMLRRSSATNVPVKLRAAITAVNVNRTQVLPHDFKNIFTEKFHVLYVLLTRRVVYVKPLSNLRLGELLKGKMLR